MDETADDRAAMRAFLQRCEVRLSTLHRVATALLSGAGILVLLPAVERDSVIQELRALLHGPPSATRLLLAAAVAISIALALCVLWLVVQELTRFYFHANHVEHEGRHVFTPRFTLTGLRLPDDELAASADSSYVAAHEAEDNVRLLVPSNDRSRDRIDRQIDAYPGLAGTGERDDAARADAMFQLAASRRRSLVEEVTKVEYGMVRHMVRLQVVVLRYVKALLVVVVTSLATFIGAAAIDDRTALGTPAQRWIAGTMLVWAPVVVLAVHAPVRWLGSLLQAEGASNSAVRADTELTRVETLTVRMAGVAWLASAVAMLVLLIDHRVTGLGMAACVVALVGSAGLHAGNAWAGRTR